MAKFIIGGNGQQIDFNIFDKTCRAMQHAMLTRLLDGKGFFFRMGGDANGRAVQHVVWVSHATSVRFEYDSELLPDLDKGLAERFREILEESGGLVFPSKTEADLVLAEIEQEQGLES